MSPTIIRSGTSASPRRRRTRSRATRANSLPTHRTGRIDLENRHTYIQTHTSTSTGCKNAHIADIRFPTKHISSSHIWWRSFFVKRSSFCLSVFCEHISRISLHQMQCECILYMCGCVVAVVSSQFNYNNCILISIRCVVCTLCIRCFPNGFKPHECNKHVSYTHIVCIWDMFLNI